MNNLKNQINEELRNLDSELGRIAFSMSQLRDAKKKVIKEIERLRQMQYAAEKYGVKQS